jgi:hypothetical protein
MFVRIRSSLPIWRLESSRNTSNSKQKLYRLGDQITSELIRFLDYNDRGDLSEMKNSQWMANKQRQSSCAPRYFFRVLNNSKCAHKNSAHQVQEGRRLKIPCILRHLPYRDDAFFLGENVWYPFERKLDWQEMWCQVNSLSYLIETERMVREKRTSAMCDTHQPGCLDADLCEAA